MSKNSRTVVADVAVGGNTRFIGIIIKKRVNHLQTSLFNSEDDKVWYNHAMNIAKQLPCKFWFSNLRFRLSDTPPRHENMWGRLASKMRAAGYRKTGRWRPSVVDSRRSGVEFEWEKPIQEESN
jgi:hypothetical protein